MSDDDDEGGGKMPLPLLKNKRKYMRSDVTKINTKIDNELATLDGGEKLRLISRLEKVNFGLESLNEQIFNRLLLEKHEEATVQAEYDSCANYSDLVSSCLISLKAGNSETNDGSRRDAADYSRGALKLPHVPLPEYGHKDGEDLHRFFLNFESVIEKYRLSSYEKFVYLQKQLSNEPLTIIKSLELGRQNYEAAKDLLQQAFASPVMQQYKVLQQLSQLKMSKNDEPYAYISQMRMLIESFSTLEIDTDVVLQYFIWSGMSEAMQSQFIHITNTNKPTLEQIKKYAFDAAERYINMRKTRNVKDPTWVTAASVEQGKLTSENRSKEKYCSWCTGNATTVKSHNSIECKKYATPEEKRALLKKLNGCIKCGNTRHTTADCRFQFRYKCANCNQAHFKYLCVAPKKDNKNQKVYTKQNSEKNKNTDSTDVQSGSVFLGRVDVEHYGEDSVIPTFTIKCAGGQTLRGMRDSGCQPTLITQRCAKRLKLKIISPKFPLKINGFNKAVKHQVNIVELKLDPDQAPIKALCVPTIQMKIKLPGLSEVARLFENKGYELADKLLTSSRDELSNLDIVLGNNDSQALPQTDVTFGVQDKSVYVTTPQGVMLMGSLYKLRKNIKFLPDVTSAYQCGVQTCGIETEFSSNIPMAMNDTHYVSGDEDINESTLTKATEDILKQSYFASQQYVEPLEDEINESEARLSKYVLDHIERAEDGRIIMPLLWREEVAHLLPSNCNLSKQVLGSNLKRLQKDPDKLEMYDNVIKEQLKLGIVEKIADIQQFLAENPNSSFLPHMGVFKLNNETTKCRIVFLSNLVASRPQKSSISHNQAMLSGPNLNQKITTAILKLRFDRHLLCFDLQKAFLSIALQPVDQNRLLFWWYNGVSRGDFSLVAYKNARLPFGLRCSPALLMLALYKVLIVDAEHDALKIKDTKKLIYDLIYMDNGCITTEQTEELEELKKLLEQIFGPYQFHLQKFFTNNVELQTRLDNELHEETPEQVKLLGLKYNRKKDTIATAPLNLDGSANTKRTILSSLAGNFDIFQFAGPVLNRARLFLHKLQCSPEIGWDTPLSLPQLSEWRRIAKQVNASKPIDINRCVGSRNSSYRLIAFTDASKLLIGTVIYIQDLATNQVSFMMARNKIVGRQLETKSVPALELQAVSLGVESLMEMQQQLDGQAAVVPIKIAELNLYADSMVALQWVNKYVNGLEKMQKTSIFVKNRLEIIQRQCSKFPVKFRFISGLENPADLITRPVSYNQLIKSNFHLGPKFLRDEPGTELESDLWFTVPNPLARIVEPVASLSTELVVQPILTETSSRDGDGGKSIGKVVPFSKYSSFLRLVRVTQYILRYVRALKRKCGGKMVNTNREVEITDNLFTTATKLILKAEQEEHFPEVCNYFRNKTAIKNIPNIMNQLNIYQDKKGILRVRGKFQEWPYGLNEFPVLLPKNSKIVKAIVNDYHTRMAHAGCYSILAQLRKQFHIPQAFITVKKILQDCVTCRKQNARTINLNQSCYRDFRSKPNPIPYRDIFVDHFGPFLVQEGPRKIKVWVLCITCLWSRAINLKVCYDLTVTEFLRTMQLHVFEYGLPERIFSDLGTQLVAGGNVITDYLKDISTQIYFEENHIRTPVFSQFFKGHKALGSLVESCVKIAKKLIYGSMGKNVLPHLQFELLIAQTVNIINKRPVAFKEALRDNKNNIETIPIVITPELLLKGYESPTVGIIPSDPESDKEWAPDDSPSEKIKKNYEQFAKIRQKLITLYHDEFLANLMQQAISKTGRFRPVLHKKLGENDIVLIKEENMKRINFPLGIVQRVICNDFGEVTAAEVRKGKTGEILKRHVSSLIPVLTNSAGTKATTGKSDSNGKSKIRDKRVAAIKSAELTKLLYNEEIV